MGTFEEFSEEIEIAWDSPFPTYPPECVHLTPSYDVMAEFPLMHLIESDNTGFKIHPVEIDMISAMFGELLDVEVIAY